MAPSLSEGKWGISQPDHLSIGFQPRGLTIGRRIVIVRGAPVLEVMNRLARAYAGRRILVTGGASFIGSHLTELLVQSGGKVSVADDLSSGKRGNLDAIASNIVFLKGDLRCPDFAAAALGGFRPFSRLSSPALPSDYWAEP